MSRHLAKGEEEAVEADPRHAPPVLESHLGERLLVAGRPPRRRTRRSGRAPRASRCVAATIWASSPTSHTKPRARTPCFASRSHASGVPVGAPAPHRHVRPAFAQPSAIPRPIPEFPRSRRPPSRADPCPITATIREHQLRRLGARAEASSSREGAAHGGSVHQRHGVQLGSPDDLHGGSTTGALSRDVPRGGALGGGARPLRLEGPGHALVPDRHVPEAAGDAGARRTPKAGPTST